MSFKTSYCNIKIRGLGVKLCVAFLWFSFWKELCRFKVKESMLFVEKNTNFDKNETESKNGKCHTQFKREEPCASAHLRIAN